MPFRVKSMGKRGPKPKPRRLIKADSIRIMVATSERKTFGSAATAQGLSLSAWMRMVCLAAAKGAVKK